MKVVVEAIYGVAVAIVALILVFRFLVGTSWFAACLLALILGGGYIGYVSIRDHTWQRPTRF